MRNIYLFLVLMVPLFVIAQNAPDTIQKIIPGRTNSTQQQRKPYIILISADGFRYDLADKYHATNLLALRDGGVAAQSMKPSYPSLTFPNHYSIATGLYPSHHGLVDNSFYDPKKKEAYRIAGKCVTDSSWYGGTPIWVLAEKQHMLTASSYWVGTEAAIQGVRPTYYYTYNTAIGIDARINTVKNWLTLPEDRRPHLITFYLPEVDHAEHGFGVDSKETAEAVHFVDDCVGRMARMVDSLKLDASFIFVADHGMATIDTSVAPMSLASIIDTSKFVVTPGNIIMHVYAKSKADVQPAYDALKKAATSYDVYLADNMPAKWHYNTKDDRYGRLGDIIIIAKFKQVLPFDKQHFTPTAHGAHGYDNDEQDMQASFYAWGPAFKQHIQIKSFANVDVYPLVAKMLGLTVEGSIDGSVKTLQGILR